MAVENNLLQWETFKLEHTKKYDAVEEERRLSIFKENLVKIEEHNKRYEDGLETYTMGITQFADMTSEEFLAFVGRSDMNDLVKTISENSTVFKAPEGFKDPTSIDWRLNGAVTGVKNQGSCGCCWSFSASEALEAQYYFKTGQLLSLSEQNLLDCTSSYGNHGCSGGVMNYAFNFVHDYGLQTESDYPYEARVGSCRFNPSRSVLNVANYYIVAPGDENNLVSAIVSVGPVAIGIHATDNLQHYTGGYFYDPSCNPQAINHAVLAVGYGGSGSQEYYIVKNSWAASWGEQGYVMMARNRQNNCGITNMASVPVLM